MDSSVTHIRPRFKFTVPHRVEKVLAQLEVVKLESEGKVMGTVVDHLLILDIPEAERHYWSPHMTFRVEADEDDPSFSVIRGLIGPRPAVWTMFVFIYFGLGLLVFSWGHMV